MSLYSDNKDLLRQIIIAHYDNPLNKLATPLNDPSYQQYHNKSASCIDDFELFVKFENDKIIDAKFSGLGCAISTASIDILCDLIKQKTVDEVNTIFSQYHALIRHEQYDEEMLDELIAFKEIYLQPNRIKCALIGIDAIEHILKEKL